MLQERQPEQFRGADGVIVEAVVDRHTAFTQLAGGELDVAIVFEHAFEPDPRPTT